MKRRLSLCLTIALAQAAHAAEVTLEIAAPEPAWLLPVTGQACGFGLGRTEACPVQLQPEGMPLVGEEGLILQVAPLLVAADYEAVLARMGVNFGLELVLLEMGDLEGFLATRTPTDGLRQLLGTPAIQFAAARTGASGPAVTEGTLSSENPRPVDEPPRYTFEPDLISANMLFVIGQSYLALQQYLPAETAFQLALRGVPNHVRAHESLGMLYLWTERYEDARTHLVRAVELGRNGAALHAALGYLEQKARRYWAAANAFQRALVLEPDQRTAQRGLLHALTETHEHAKARVLVEQLLQDEPDDVALWLYRAQIALAANERAVALASLETALRLGDDSSENRHACVALHLESGNIARAIKLLQGTSRPALSFPLLDQALGWLENENEWDEFRDLLNTVDRTTLGAVEQSRLLTRRATLALHDGNRRASSAGLQEALALDPANADALMLLGQSYRVERDYGRADLLFQSASAYAAARENALVARADVAIDQEDFDGALAHLRDVAIGNPLRGDVRRNIDVLEDLVLLRTQR
jgi:tetratricopeptide (TPR) repeat protein